MKLPTTLDREPLVDAVFEVRMSGTPQLADLLPGALFRSWQPKPSIDRLPAAEIPRPIRDQDPNLAFAPIIRLDLGEFTVSVGDRSLVIACKLPYPKWPRFKAAILKIVSDVTQVGIAGAVERYSIKYVNLIQAPTLSSQISKINMAVKLGDVEAKDGHLSVQVHSDEGDILHILSIITGAQVNLPGQKPSYGVVVDIDSIRAAHFSDLGAFEKQLVPVLESLRQENKKKFFSCLKEETINEMGPKYD